MAEPLRRLEHVDEELVSRGRFAAGVAYVVASALCYGSMPIFARIAYAAGVDTPTMLFLRFWIAASILGIACVWRRPPWPGRKDLGLLVAMGGLGYAGQAFCYFSALTLASAGLVALLLYLYPALVALFARVLFRQALEPRQLLAIGMALTGSFMTIGHAGDGRPLGVALGLLAAGVYASYVVAGSRLGRVSSRVSTAVVTGAAALVFTGVVTVRGARWPATFAGWSAILAIALICTTLAITFFLIGLERLGPIRASIYSTVEPAFTLLLAAIVLEERVTPLRLAGGALILGAVVLLARADRGRSREEVEAPGEDEIAEPPQALAARAQAASSGAPNTVRMRSRS